MLFYTLQVLFVWNSSSEATLWDEGTDQPITAFSDGGPFGDVRDYFLITDKFQNNKWVTVLGS